jgi:hypothetical protein
MVRPRGFLVVAHRERGRAGHYPEADTWISVPAQLADHAARPAAAA